MPEASSQAASLVGAPAARSFSRLRDAHTVQAVAGVDEPGVDVLPVHDVPEGIDVVRLHVPALQVLGVLPDVEGQQWRGGDREVRVVVQQLLGEQPPAQPARP
jgi:hypothetical protein